MTDCVTITGMKLREKKVTKGGNSVHATFDFITDTLGMKGCSLYRRPDGAWDVWAPSVVVQELATDEVQPTRSVYFRGNATEGLHGAVQKAAMALYQLMLEQQKAA